MFSATQKKSAKAISLTEIALCQYNNASDDYVLVYLQEMLKLYLDEYFGTTMLQRHETFPKKSGIQKTGFHVQKHWCAV